MANNIFRLSIFCILLTAFTSCVPLDSYEKIHIIENEEWLRNDSLTFDFEILDSTELYDVFYIIRHKADFEYSNLWVSLTQKSPTSAEVSRDDQLVLASNSNGRWIGNCIGDICDVKLPLARNIRFNELGKYQVKVNHISRDSIIKHVLGFGLLLEKNN